jgi:hypothetical protein
MQHARFFHYSFIFSIWLTTIIKIRLYTYNLYNKGKVTPVLLTEHHAMKAYWRVEL